jgi:hypothetical protein
MEATISHVKECLTMGQEILSMKEQLDTKLSTPPLVTMKNGIGSSYFHLPRHIKHVIS